MIAKSGRGSDVGGLLRYLFGPGRSNDHLDPHLVAAWDPDWLPGEVLGDALHQPGGLARLARELDTPRRIHDVPAGGHVYHVVISLPAADGELGDQRWQRVVEDGVAALGLDEHRWIAVHHGPSSRGCDHVHLVVQLVDPDGRTPSLFRERMRWRAWCRRTEDRLGLTPTAPAGAGQRGVGRREAAQHRRADRPVGRWRAELLRRVHHAAATAADELEFVAILRRGRVAVRWRHDAAGRVTGYAVALAHRDGTPAGPWTAASALRRDLSLPRLRGRWRQAPPATVVDEHQVRALLAAAPDELRRYLQLHHNDPGVWHCAALVVADLGRRGRTRRPGPVVGGRPPGPSGPT